MTVSFAVSQYDQKLIHAIVDRAWEDGYIRNFYTNVKENRIDMQMDITAVHASGNPLRLQELLEANKSNFTHDVLGIATFLNRETGKLDCNFRLLFSVPTARNLC